MASDFLKNKAKKQKEEYREKYNAAVKQREARTQAKGLMANNPGYVYSKTYGDGTTGAAANKVIKGAASAKDAIAASNDAITRNNPAYSYLQREGATTVTRGSDAIIENPSSVEWYKKILRGMDTGLTSFGQSLTSLADVVTSLGDESGGPLQELWYMFGGDRIMQDNPVKALNKLGQSEVDYRSRHNASMQDDPFYKYSAMLGETIPMLIPSIMTGGATAFGEAAGAASELAAASKVGQTASNLGKTYELAKNSFKNLASRPDAQTIFGSVLGSSYDEAKQDGADDGQALTYAILNGVANTVTELGGADTALGGLQNLPSWLKNAIEKGDKSLLLNYAKSVGEETSEELIQGILGRGFKSLYSDVPLYDPNNENSIINPEAAIDEATGAAVVTTLLGLPTVGINAQRRARQNRSAKEIYGNSQQELVNEGLQSEQGSESYELAQKYNEKLSEGKKLSGNELYKLAKANEDAITQEQTMQGAAPIETNTPEIDIPEITGTAARSDIPYAAMQQNAPITVQTYNAPVNFGGIQQSAQIQSSVENLSAKYNVSDELIGRVYNLNPTAPQAFETAFNAVYQMGQQGTDKAALGKVPVLSTAQANIAYQMGADSVNAANVSTEAPTQAATVQAAAPVTINNTQEVSEDGVRIHNVAERINGQNTEGQIRGVETGAGENVAGGSQKEQGGISAAQIKAGEKVSYKGKQQKGVYYAAEDTEDMKKGRKLAESYGYNVRYFVGGNIRYAGGEFRGVVDTANKTVMVRADHPDYTADQIMRHEMGHAAFENGDLSLNEAKEMLLGDFTEGELNELIEIYNNAYGGILSTEEAFEEICCDALGRMNIFERTDLNSESYGKAQDTVRKYAADKTGSKGRAPPKKGGVKYSKEQTKYDYSKPFAEQIDDWIAGKIPKRDTLIVGGTPKVFADIGMPSLPVTINSSHVDYALNGTKDFDHELGKDLLKQLPEAIKNPVAIMTSKTKSSNSIVAMLEIRHNAKQVVVPVGVTGFGYQNGIRIDSNSITSAYGKNYSIAKVLREAIQEESNGQFRLYYLNEKKATALLQGAKVPMPKMPATRNGGFIHSLTEANSPVKLKIKDVTESQQFKRWFGNSKVINSDGTPKIVYHQTENEFTVFETRREGAGTRDNGTPFGIFLKSSNKDIGLRGKKQMALYAKIENPLRAKNRSEFLKAMQSMSSEYAEIINQHEALDREYKEKTQSAMKEFKNYIIEWRADNPGVDSRALYDDAKFNELFEAEDTLASEWTSKADKLSTKAKEAMTKALESNGYDGVILEKDDGSFGRSTDAYIVLHPEQVKSATDNIGTFDSSNPDIRYSREPERLNELRRQNEELKQRVEYWKNQTKPTTTRTVRKGDIQKLAREVIEMSDTDLKPGDITESLSKLGEYILNEPELRYTDVAEMANSIASEVIENATAIVNEDDVEIHNELNDYLKRVKFRDDGSTEFASVRRNYKRRIMFDKNGLGVDTAYTELHNMFGEGFFPEDIINPGDMLERIAEVLDGTAPKYGNPNSYYSKEATEFLRNYIIDSMLGDQVRQTAPTYADKANAKLAETKADYNQRLRKQREEFNEKTTSIKEQNKQRVKEAISKERQRGERRLQKFRDSVKERDTKRKEAAEKSRYKKQIEKNVKTLSDWLLKPDHKNALKHIPGELQSTVRDFIASINFTSARQLGGGAATQKDMRYLSNLERLHRYITDSNVGEDRYSGYLDLPPNFDVELGNFIHEVNALARKNSGYTINDMTVEQLKELSDIVKTMKKTITDMNRMYQNKTFQHAYDAGVADVETLKGYVKTKAFTSNLATNRLDQTVMWEQSRPAHVFKRFGKGGESIYHEFADGQGTMAFLTKEVIDFSAETYKSGEVKAWAKETHTFEFGGDKVTLTTAQLMSLYELNKRTQAKQHIDSGGFRVANFKNGHFNLKTDKNSHRFTDIELGEMFSKLTDRQKEVADKLQRFMVEKGGAWGNYISIKRFDVEMFKDENYFPIKVDSGQLDAKETESVDNASLYQLLNMGFAKDVSAKADQALVVYDIFDVFANHMAEMAQYRSFALPVLDAMKWFNYKERNESGAVTASLREEMRRAFGSDVNGRGFAEKFITGVIKAYNGAEGRGDNSLNSKMLNRVNRSAVAYNTRVMIQQPSAIVRAAMFLNPSDLAASLKNYVGITTKANIEEMHKYSGLAVWKDLGFYDVNVSRGVQELIKHSQGAVSKINEFGMKGAELADKVTWAALWDASKRKVSRETGLNKNDAEFFPKVVELFEDTVYNTQVVDTVLTKSELTRNKSFGVRLFTSFMSEPMTTASLVTSEIFDIQMKQAAGQKLGLSDYKRLSKTCVVVTLAAIVNSALAALADAWRDDDDYGTFGEKWTRALQVKLADELMPLTYFPFVSNVWDITKILLDDADKKWFGVAVYGNGTDIPLTDIVSSAEKALEIFREIDEKGDKARYTKFGGYYKIVNILSKITGVPFYNATREIVTLHNILLPSDKWRSYEPKPENAIQFAWRDGYLTDEEALEYLQDEEIMGSEVLDEGKAWFALNKWKTGDTSDYTKLYEELDKSGDIKGAVDELREHGKEDGNIKGRVTDHFKDAYINGSSAEREKIRRAMYATGLYDSVNDVIEKCNDWLKKTK